jgi:hypothetical protein
MASLGAHVEPPKPRGLFAGGRGQAIGWTTRLPTRLGQFLSSLIRPQTQFLEIMSGMRIFGTLHFEGLWYIKNI